MSFPSSAPSLSRGEGTGGGGGGGPLPTLGRSDGGRPPPAPSSSASSAAAAAASNPSAPRAATPDINNGNNNNNNNNNNHHGGAAAAPSSSPASENPNKRGRNPFESPVLNTYTLPGTEHSTWRRWVLELGLFLGAALAVLGPAVGLAVMTPYISVTSGLASDLRKDADCLKVAPEVREERERGREREREAGRRGRGACFSPNGHQGREGKKNEQKKNIDLLCSPFPLYLFPLSSATFLLLSGLPRPPAV